MHREETEAQTIARIEQEAKAGNAQSQFNMGRIYYTGYGVAQDDAKARDWFCTAAKQDHPIAKSQCASMLYYGQGGPEDKTLAMRYLKDAAEKGDPYGEALYGLFTYQEGLRAGIMAADAQTIAYLVDAADHGETVAQATLGSIIFVRGSAQDLPRAVKYLRMCDAKGIAVCTGTLGSLVFYGAGGLDKDEAAGVAMLRSAADAGHNASCGVLANIYNDDNGPYPDTGLALHYAQLGSAGDNPDAASEFLLGLYTYLGVGIEKNVDEGRRIIRLAAEDGDPQGQYYIGVMYYNGEGVEKDLVEAARWWKLAAAQGVPIAIEKLQLPEMIEAASHL